MSDPLARSTKLETLVFGCPEKFSVDIGAGDTLENSQSEFLLAESWPCLFFEYDMDKCETLAKRTSGSAYATVVHAKITPDNVIELFKQYKVPKEGFYLSLDIDGYDYYVLKAILEEYRPYMIISEINEKIPPPIKFAVKYDENYEWGGNHFYGYSIQMAETIISKYHYELVTLDYNNVIFRASTEDYAKASMAHIESIYKAGYLDKPDRVTSFYWNADVEELYSMTPNNQFKFISDLFSKIKYKYVLLPVGTQENSLVHYAKNVFSQRGDDGIIEEIFRRLCITNGVFVEFGAGDGVYLSNTCNLISKGWTGVMIESDRDLARQLFRNYNNNANVTPICAEVINDDEILYNKSIEVKLKDLPVQHIDFMSIDIDFNDVEIFEALQMDIKPTVISLETGIYWNPRYNEKVINRQATRGTQQPIGVAINIARTKGYVPICFNQNLYLVLEDYEHLFSDINKDPVILWYDAYFSDKIFSERERKFIQLVRKTNTLISDTEGPDFEEL